MAANEAAGTGYCTHLKTFLVARKDSRLFQMLVEGMSAVTAGERCHRYGTELTTNEEKVRGCPTNHISRIFF